MAHSPTREWVRLYHFVFFFPTSRWLSPATTSAMLFSCRQGEDGTEFSSFPLSWAQPKRNGVRLGRATIPAYSLKSYETGLLQFTRQSSDCATAAPQLVNPQRPSCAGEYDGVGHVASFIRPETIGRPRSGSLADRHFRATGLVSSGSLEGGAMRDSPNLAHRTLSRHSFFYLRFTHSLVGSQRSLRKPGETTRTAQSTTCAQRRS